jgi:hypothetical protein
MISQKARLREGIKTSYHKKVMMIMSIKSLPWSFYAIIITFAIFFFCLNVYILTRIFNHPYASDLWLIGVIIGLVGLLYSIRMVRIHQAELILKKQEEETNSSESAE